MNTISASLQAATSSRTRPSGVEDPVPNQRPRSDHNAIDRITSAGQGDQSDAPDLRVGGVWAGLLTLSIADDFFQHGVLISTCSLSLRICGFGKPAPSLLFLVFKLHPHACFIAATLRLDLEFAALGIRPAPVCRAKPITSGVGPDGLRENWRSNECVAIATSAIPFLPNRMAPAKKAEAMDFVFFMVLGAFVLCSSVDDTSWSGAR